MKSHKTSVHNPLYHILQKEKNTPYLNHRENRLSKQAFRPNACIGADLASRYIYLGNIKLFSTDIVRLLPAEQK